MHTCNGIPRYVPVAEYTIGLYHYGAKRPYELAVVKADSMHEAMTKGRAALKPSTVEHIKHVETRPNPDHVLYNKQGCLCSL